MRPSLAGKGSFKTGKLVAVRLPPDLEAELRAVAATEGLSFSETVRVLLGEGLGRWREARGTGQDAQAPSAAGRRTGTKGGAQ